MKLTYYGHSCFSVLVEGKNLLFDPFVSENGLAKHVHIEDIHADYIFVSHGHFDHILDVVAIAKRTGAMVVGGWELYNYFGKQGLGVLRPLNPGGKFTFDFGTVKAVSAQHSSSFQDGSYAGVACGFVIKSANEAFYYSGDSAVSFDMTLIPSWTQLDFAVLPIGDVLTMGVDDAIEAARFVKTDKVVGVHYNTFPFIEIDKAKSIRQFEDSKLKLYLPNIGETIVLSRG